MQKLHRVRAVVASCVIAALIVVPESSALADVVVKAGPVAGVAAASPEIPDNGDLNADDIARLGGEPKVRETAPAPEMPSGELVEPTKDETAAGAQAARFSQRPEKPEADGAELAARADDGTVEEQGEFWTTYKTDEGSHVRKESMEPLNYQTEKGEWYEMSTELTKEDCFGKSPTTGLSGPSGPLAAYLDANGTSWKVVP